MGGKGRGYAVASSRLIGLLAARSRVSDTWASAVHPLCVT